MTIPKASMLADLDYYGLHDDADPLLVNSNSVVDELMELNEIIEDALLKKAYLLLLASRLWAEVVHTESLTIDLSPEDKRAYTQVNPIIFFSFDDNCMKIFNECLALYGLCFDSNNLHAWCQSFFHNLHHSMTLSQLSKGLLSKNVAST